MRWDKTERKMTKIARELNKLTVQTMKEEGIGTAEFDFIHLVRHHPGITQAQLREELKIDKGAAARRAASLGSEGLPDSPGQSGGQKKSAFVCDKKGGRAEKLQGQH